MQMPRYIDADKFEVIGGSVPEGYDAESYLAGCKEILEMIDAAPTIDAVEVVRCGGCKWFAWYVKEFADQVGCDGVCNKYLCEGRKRTDYCSHGVPWEDAEVEG